VKRLVVSINLRVPALETRAKYRYRFSRGPTALQADSPFPEASLLATISGDAAAALLEFDVE
jgi:hypothetical protein